MNQLNQYFLVFSFLLIGLIEFMMKVSKGRTVMYYNPDFREKEIKQAILKKFNLPYIDLSKEL